jgi:PAS domain S-box-containing protein
LWIYVVASTLWVADHWGETAAVGVMGDWAPVAAGLITLIALATHLRVDARAGPRRYGWWLLFWSVVLDFAANVAWTGLDAATLPVYRALADGLYLLTYPLIIGALAMFFLNCGGSFRRPQLWLDALTVMLGVLVILWALLYEPPFIGGPHHIEKWNTKVLYTLWISLTMSMTALLYMQIVDWGNERATMLVMVATLVGVACDIAWLGADAGGSGVLGPIYNVSASVYNLGDIACCALLASAAAAEQSRPTGTARLQNPEIDAYSFLPAFALLLAITLLVLSAATLRGLDIRILIGVVLLGTALLVARQQSVRRELQRLNHDLIVREADARLTELVRCSADVLAVVNANGVLVYVSPAADKVLGIPAANLLSTPAAALLGEPNQTALAEFLSNLVDHPGEAAELEVTMARPGEETRSLRLVGSNQFENPRIVGITLVIHDISEERLLERVVLDIATRERRSLSSEVHEGLCQDLAGIALLVNTTGAHAERDPRLIQDSLQGIVGHLRDATDRLRSLAISLSPLQVVRGSLVDALTQLTSDVNGRLSVHIEAGLTFSQERLDDTTADHLYRIVQDSINAALRNGDCTAMQVALHTAQAKLTLTITSYGVQREPGKGRGLALRLIEYRARVMHGQLRVEQATGIGTRLTVTVPMYRAVRAL